MIKKLIKTFAVSLLTGMLSMTALAASDSPVYFTKNNDFTIAPTSSKNITQSISWELTTDPNGESSRYDDDEITITNIKSSNKKVATIDATWNIPNQIWFNTGNNCGTTTISFTANGKSYSQKLTVKYNCPVSAFTVDKTNALSTFKKKNIFTSSKTVKNKKVVIKAKKGWIIDQVRTNCSKSIFKTKSKDYKVNKTSWSGKVTFTTPYDSVCAELHNLSTGEEQTCLFQLGMIPGFSHVGG